MKKRSGIYWLFMLLFYNSFSQNIGIGISNPTRARLEVASGGSFATAIFGSDGAGIALERNFPNIGYNVYWASGGKFMSPGGAIDQHLNMNLGNMYFQNLGRTILPNSTIAGSTDFLTISQNGNVCLCSGDQNATLVVGNPQLGITSARFRGTAYHSVINTRDAPFPTQSSIINGGKAGSRVVLNDITGGYLRIGLNTGKVGINIDPTDVLEVKQVGNRGIIQVNSNFGNWEFAVYKNLTENGSDLYMFSNEIYKGNFFHIDGKYYPSSDRRLKTGIEDLPPTLKGLKALRPVEYEMKYDNPGRIKSIGLIAQEVKPLFPELVEVQNSSELGYDGMTGIHTMNYDALAPIVIKAIQEQQEIIKNLRRQNEILRQRVEKAEKLFSTIQ